MKLLLLILLHYSLLIAAQNQRKNLSEIIIGKQKQGNTIINIFLGNYSYYLDGDVVVENLTEFTLIGNNESSVNCLHKMKKSTIILRIASVPQVTLKDVIFEDCLKKRITIQKQLTTNPVFLFFRNCGTVHVSNCTFNNVFGINLVSIKTQKLSVEDSQFLIEKRGTSKAILAITTGTGSHNSSLEVRRNVFKGMYWPVNYPHDQVQGLNFSIKCGSVLSAFYLTEGSSQVHIVDNNMSAYTASEGGAFCVSIGEGQVKSVIKIERGSFVSGQAKNTAFGRKNHERPNGGALALFLYGKSTELTISECNFTDNKAYRGGALYIDYSITPKLSEIKNCRFENNSGTLGGAMMITSSLSPEGVLVNLSNSTFIGNKGEFAGAILGHRVTIATNETVIVASNEVRKGSGGGIGLIYSNLYVNGHLEINNNSADGGGGGIYLSSQCIVIMSTDRKSVLNIIGNKAGTYGGGIYANSLQYHNLFLNMSVSNNIIRSWCFLRGEHGRRHESLIVMRENKANSKSCAGNTGYTQMLGKCFEKKIIQGRVDLDNQTTCRYSTREKKFHIKINTTSHFNCNSSIFSEALDYGPIHQIQLSKFCKNNGSFDPFIMEDDHITSKTISELHKLHPYITKFHYLYPGYIANITISAIDHFGFNVVTRANLSGWIFADGQKSKMPYKYILMNDNNNNSTTQRTFLTKFSDPITLRSQWTGLGVICVESIGNFYKKSSCIGVLMGECPPGFFRGGDQDQCVCQANKKLYTCSKGNNITVNRGNYIANKYIIKDLKGINGTNCLWSRCKCHFGAPDSSCQLNPMLPDDQCLPGLRGILCGNCSEPNKALIFSPFLQSLEPFGSCTECESPVLMIVLVVLLIIAIGLAIMVFRVNLFDDYWRSIIFYANILYMILVNSNPYIRQFMNIALAIPILPLNLLVTQIVPFCLSAEKNVLYTALFDMTVPWAVLLIFFSLQKFLVTKVSWLSTRNVPTQIWSMLLLTYTDLSIHVFMILTCPVIGENRYWLYHGDTICYQHEHLAATLISLFYMFVLTSIPLFLLFIIFCTEKDFQFHHNITREFKHNFRWWEVYKLFLRLVISLLLSYVSNYIDPTVTNLIVSIICLFTMIMNSLYQPANNILSNHFESLCLLSLAITTTLQDHWAVNYTPIIPFIVGAVLIVCHQKIPLWRGQIKKIREEFRKEKRILDKTITMLKIWDVKNSFELDSV